jgi:membrane-associated phospholipid phosphatase
MLLASAASQLLAKELAAPACRWCEPDQLDRWARRELRWRDTKAAANLSDVLAYGLPVGAALTLGLSARAAGAGMGEVEEDLLAATEAIAAGTLLTQASKFATGRLRPDGWARGGGTTADSKMSFWGGHTMLAFTVAAALTQVARLRARPGWRWMALASFLGAAATAWLRVAADRHWLSDVVVGAGVGTAVGLGVPLLVLRPAGERAVVTLVPAPGGLAILF